MHKCYYTYFIDKKSETLRLFIQTPKRLFILWSLYLHETTVTVPNCQNVWKKCRHLWATWFLTCCDISSPQIGWQEIKKWPVFLKMNWNSWNFCGLGGTLRHMVIYGIRTFSSLWCFPALPKQSFSSRDYNEEFHSSISSPGRAENRSRVM
jgi:hypothetical protein